MHYGDTNWGKIDEASLDFGALRTWS